METIANILSKVRTLFLSLTGVLGWGCLIALFAACSGSDPVEPTPTTPSEGQKAISLAGGLPDETAVTRAAQGLEELLDNKSFTVWGYKNDAYTAPNYTSYQVVMPGYTVNYGANTAYTTTSNTNNWEYVGQATGQDIKYWDFAAKAYRFFGYALGNSTADPATSPATVTVNGGTLGDAPAGTAVTFTTAVDASSAATINAAPYFTRLWFSNNSSDDYGKPVTLQFLKPFARVRFMFIYVEDLGFGREKIKDPRFRPTVNTDDNQDNNQIIATAGTVTVSYPLKGSATAETWTVAADPAPTGIDEFNIDYYEAPDPVPPGYPVDALPTSWPRTPEKWYYVLPAENQGSYTLQVCVASDEVKTAVIPSEYMNWKAGYEYTYKFKVTESGGITMDVIQVAINDWGNKTTSNHTVYNW